MQKTRMQNARALEPKHAPVAPSGDGGPGLTEYVLLFVLALVWGNSFLFIKIAVDAIPPLTLTTIRLASAAVALSLAAWYSGQRVFLSRSNIGLLAVAAATGNALPFVLISWGMERIDSGITAILMAFMPLATVLLAHFVTTDEKLGVYRLAGVLFGLCGILVLVGPEKLLHLGDETIRELAIIAATCCYAVNAILTKRLSLAQPIATVAVIMLIATLSLAPFAFAFEDPFGITPTAADWLATLTLGLVQTAAATLVMFALIRRQGASFFSQINFLVPIIGVMMGALVLGETPGPNAVLALAIILLGIAVSRRGGRRVTKRQDTTAQRP